MASQSLCFDSSISVGPSSTVNNSRCDQELQTLGPSREQLKAASRVCFLCFGYHPINRERLAVHKLGHGNQVVRGTALGLSKGEWSQSSRPSVDVFICTQSLTRCVSCAKRTLCTESLNDHRHLRSQHRENLADLSSTVRLPR